MSLRNNPKGVITSTKATTKINRVMMAERTRANAIHPFSTSLKEVGNRAALRNKYAEMPRI